MRWDQAVSSPFLPTGLNSDKLLVSDILSLDKSRQEVCTRWLYVLELAMSLRKSPTLTPALLEACRRNAQKSTGPRTAPGKANMRMNALREGRRSRLWRRFADALFSAPPGAVEGSVRALLTPDLARCPLFTNLAEVAINAESPQREWLRQLRAHLRRMRQRKKDVNLTNKAGMLLKINDRQKRSPNFIGCY